MSKEPIKPSEFPISEKQNTSVRPSWIGQEWKVKCVPWDVQGQTLTLRFKFNSVPLAMRPVQTVKLDVLLTIQYCKRLVYNNTIYFVKHVTFMANTNIIIYVLYPTYKILLPSLVYLFIPTNTSNYFSPYHPYAISNIKNKCIAFLRLFIYSY